MATNITLDLEQSFGALNDAVLITNSDRIIVFANSAMEKLLRVDNNDLVGSTTKQFFADPSRFEKMGELYNTPSDQRHRKTHTLDLVLGDGTTTIAEVVGAPLFNSEQNLTGLLFIARDVSERKALEEKISDIALTLEDALDAIPEGFAIFDSDDRLIICNENYRDIYLPSAPSIFPGNRYEDILRYGLDKRQYKTGSLDDEAWLAKRLEQHQSADGAIVEQRLENGSWLRISETRTRSGGIAGIRADITELKEAKALSEKAYKNLLLMADNVAACITEVDLDGVCLFVNKTGCEWFNESSEVLVGTRLRDRLSWKEREIIKGLFREALKGQKVSSEFSIDYPDGVLRECQMDCSPRINEDGEVEGLVVLVNDFTDRKKTERALAELYAITSTRELSHEDKIAEILRLGCEHFELSFGIISHVSEDQYTITHARSPNGELEPGTVYPLGDTYCAKTLEADEAVATGDAAKSDFTSHACHKIFDLGSYIGAPVLVDGILHGTINFSASERRKRPFSSADIQIVRQFADWVGHEIARQLDHQALMDAKNDLERVASIDDLTQVLNRRAFLDLANAEIHRYRRDRAPFTAVMMDIDRFKKINDRHGHAAGDEVLRKFANAVSDTLRVVDIFGRVGGEEFCMILHRTNMADAMLVCERLRKKIAEDCQLDVLKEPVTCSMGLANPAREDVEFSTLMQRADAALYQAKATGRDKCVPFSVSLDAVGT